MFSKHLELLRINHTMGDLPSLDFEPIDEETRLNKMQRANMGYAGGILTLNQALHIVGEPQELEGDVRKGEDAQPANTGRLPRENSQNGGTETRDGEQIDEE